MLRNVDLQSDLRRAFKAAWQAHARTFQRLLDVGVGHTEAYRLSPPIDFARFVDLRCGAKTKGDGSPCKLRSLYTCGRCRFHGGLSTGPRTKRGKTRAALNGRLAYVADHAQRTGRHD